MRLSVYHSLIGIVSHDSPMYLWDYEVAKILGEIRLQSGEITSFCFVNGYSCVLLGTDQLLCLLKLERKIGEIKIE